MIATISKSAEVRHAVGVRSDVALCAGTAVLASGILSGAVLALVPGPLVPARADTLAVDFLHARGVAVAVIGKCAVGVGP